MAGAEHAGLDPKSLALIRLAGLVAVGGAVPSYGALADAVPDSRVATVATASPAAADDFYQQGVFCASPLANRAICVMAAEPALPEDPHPLAMEDNDDHAQEFVQLRKAQRLVRRTRPSAHISLCQCYECQRRTGSVFSVQTRLPIEHVKIEGESTAWSFPNGSGKPATFRSCDSAGATYHFCPECGSTVYWEISIAPDFLGVAVGGFTDPTFPPPMISGFEAYGPAMGDERLGPSDAASRLRRDITRRATSMTMVEHQNRRSGRFNGANLA